MPRTRLAPRALHLITLTAGLTGLTLLALAGPARADPSTWGRVKQLYRADRAAPAGPALGPGVSATDALVAVAAVETRDPAGLRGEIRVVRLAGTPQGDVFGVAAQDPLSRAVVAHVVTPGGQAGPGVRFDPHTGIVRDLESGKVLFRGGGDHGTGPDGIYDDLQRFFRGMSRAACAGIAAQAFKDCVGIGAAGGVGGFAICLALSSAIGLLCNTFADLDLREAPPWGEPGDSTWTPGSGCGCPDTTGH